MKKGILITLIIAASLLLFLAILWGADRIGLITLLPHVLALSGVIAATVACRLLLYGKGILKFTGITASVAGLLIWLLCAYRILELTAYWNTGIDFLFTGLAIGLYTAMQVSHPLLKWTFALALLLVVIVAAGILFKAGSPVFYTFGMISMLLFSAVALLSVFTKKA